MSNVININLFAGPGAGKTTTAAGLFYKLKLEGWNVEYVTEYAKDLTYGHDDVKLSDQLLILGKQHHKIFRLRDDIKIIIHDSPFVMGLTYLKPDEHLPEKEFKNLIVAMFKSYNNINIFIERNEKQEYSEIGRAQKLDDAIKIDKQIKALLNDNDIKYKNIKNSLNVVNEILFYIREKI